ncbi:serpin family protein [bacterium]|nr:serpin family protein [bacterium]
MRKNIFAVVLLLSVFLVLGFLIKPLICQTTGEENIEVKSMVNANSRFGFKLYNEILKKDIDKNTFISPYSVSIALSMTYNGANTETKIAMQEALEYSGIELDDLNSMNLSLKEALEKTDPKVQLNIANSLWAKKGIAFVPEFMDRNEEFYQAKVITLDFGDPAAPREINNWVDENTQHKIKKIIDTIDPLAILYLINAIYFKGSWTEEFDKDLTADKPFHLLDGSTIERPMMSQHGEYKYFENDKFQAIRLPYGDNKRLGMYVFLPGEKSGLNGFLKELSFENWEGWISQFRIMEGTIKLPRFQMEYEIGLNNALIALGMGVAFSSSEADFTEMVRSCPEGNVFIKEVKHKTFVKVNEEGTEAAAVTMVMMAAESESPSFLMVVDRPFFFAITDSQTGTVLFMGTVVEPEE